MELYTEIEIQAPIRQVWEHLTDFASFPQWNPFIANIKGDLIKGGKLEVTIQPPGGQKMTFHSKVLKVDSNYELSWIGRFLLPGIFDGEHSFCLEEIEENRVRLVQKEIFSGVLVPLFTKDLNTKVRQGFQAMNQALKFRSEQSKV